jgi:pyruvate/2-oxoglutarate dehydrogenase complex dihydrolipoamide acyltransferase (E2) component
VTTELKLPQYGMGMSEGHIVAWLKQPGDPVEKGEAVVEVEAAKATVEVPAPVSGTLARILVEPGETVPVYHVLALIDDGRGDAAAEAEAASAAGPAAAASAGEAAAADAERVSPRLRRLAARHGVDLSAVVGTGPGGRVLEDDVLRAAQSDP